VSYISKELARFKHTWFDVRTYIHGPFLHACLKVEEEKIITTTKTCIALKALLL
jgi:hypothetical protein